MTKSIHHPDSSNTDAANHLFVHSVLENQTKTMFVFKDFPGLENREKNSRTFKDPQVPWLLVKTTPHGPIVFLPSLDSVFTKLDFQLPVLNVWTKIFRERHNVPTA